MSAIRDSDPAKRQTRTPEIPASPGADSSGRRALLNRLGQQSVGVMIANPPRRLSLTLLMLVYVVGLHQVYQSILAPNFGASGIAYRAPTHPDYEAIVVIVLLTAQVLPSRIDRVSGFMLWALFLSAGAPAALMAQYSYTLPRDEAMRFAVVICVVTASMALLLRGNPIPVIRGSSRFASELWLLILAITLIVNLYLLLFVGVQVRYLSFADVNDVRQSYVITTTTVPFIGYLLASQLNVINPFLIFWGLTKRNFLSLSLGVTCQIVGYLTTGQKHTILLMLLLICFFYGRAATSFRPQTFLRFVIATSVIALLVDQLTSSLTWSSLLVRRFLVVPGVLAAAYVAVFTVLPHGRFFDVIGQSGPVDESAARTVGRVFLHSTEASANVNLFGHGYYSLGYPGIFIEGAFVVVLLWLADAATHRRVPLAWACAIFAGPTVALTNTSPFTTFLTHGFATALVVALLMPPVATVAAGGRSARSEVRVPRTSRVRMPPEAV